MIRGPDPDDGWMLKRVQHDEAEHGSRLLRRHPELVSGSIHPLAPSLARTCVHRTLTGNTYV